LQSTVPHRRATARLAITPNLHPGYRLRRLRGRGSFGQVWEAEKDTGEACALKFLPCAGDQAGLEVRSLQLIRECAHPGLVRIDKVWTAPGCLVVAMELADGSLADLLALYQADLGTALPREHILPLLTQAAEALDFLNTCQHYVHDAWVTFQHCDVTPANLLVFGETVKVSDFGLTTALTSFEKKHQRAGTPAYAGPEVFQGRVSENTDQYALAACYCMLRGGRLPFPDSPSTFEPRYVRPAPDLSMLEPEERPAVSRALAPVPQDRWPSCGVLLARLAGAGTPESLLGPRAERRRAPRHRPGAGVSCEVLPTLGNQPWRAEVQDLSAGGVRLRVYQPGYALRPGRMLDVALVRAKEGLRVPVRVCLTHSAKQESGDYEVGGTFEHMLDSGQVEALLGGGLP
jgi:serine/threonine protein kinase